MPDPLEAQIPVILEVLEALDIAVVGADGYEADDVIGTLATGAGMPVDVVTGDRDLFQLVDDEAGVRVLYIARGVGRHERVTAAVVRDKYAVEPHQYADFATLRGDASDGLPGVAGVGEKTAATLLQRFGDIEGIVAAADDPDSDLGPGPRGKIKAARDYLTVAPEVVAVARDLDLGSYDADAARHPTRPRPGRGAQRALGARLPARPRGDGDGRASVQRRVGHDAAAQRGDGVAGGAPQRGVSGGVDHLAGQVDQLLDPAHEVAGGEVGAQQDVVEVVAQRPAIRGPGEAGVGLAQELQTCSRSTSARSRHSRAISSITGRLRPPGHRRLASSVRRASKTSSDSTAASSAGSRPRHRSCRIDSAASRSMSE